VPEAKRARARVIGPASGTAAAGAAAPSGDAVTGEDETSPTARARAKPLELADEGDTTAATGGECSGAFAKGAKRADRRGGGGGKGAFHTTGGTTTCPGAGTCARTARAGASKGRHTDLTGTMALFGKHALSCSSVGRMAGTSGTACTSRRPLTRSLTPACDGPNPSWSNATPQQCA
jgi:hypothetical protein